MLSKLTVKSKAKVNLFLHVNGKYPNNYHELESLVAFTDDIYDIINVKESDKLTLKIEGEFASQLPVENNIILKAAHFLKNDLELGAEITLTKNLPISSGIGGGSSNAATTLKLLSNLWDIKEEVFLNKLERIGADVPCCYYGKLTYFNGIGEILTRIQSFPKIYIVIINPLKSISTPEIFQNFNRQYSEKLPEKPRNFNSVNELIDFLKKQKNDLQDSAVRILPEINEMISTLLKQNNCLISRMTGSGATCFGLFATESDARKAYINIKSKFNWWIRYSSLN